MDRKHDSKIVPIAKILRKNMTKEERKLWYEFLRKHPARFSRQKVLGKYIADFYSAKANLVVELDGGQHFEPQEMEKDKQRTNYFLSFGITVVRIPNNEVKNNFEGVCEYINNVLNGCE